MFKGVQELFKKPDPKELVRKWQGTLRAEQRNIERQIRGAGERRAGRARWPAALGPAVLPWHRVQRLAVVPAAAPAWRPAAYHPRARKRVPAMRPLLPPPPGPHCRHPV